MRGPVIASSDPGKLVFECGCVLITSPETIPEMMACGRTYECPAVQLFILACKGEGLPIHETKRAQA